MPARADLAPSPRGRLPESRTAGAASPARRGSWRSRRRRAARHAPFRCPAGSGAPKPITVRQAISDGRSLLRARSIAAAIASGSWPSIAAGRPARGLEARQLVVRAGQRGRAVDRDLVVVEQHDQPAEPEMPGERDRLVAEALHQAAVAGDHIGDSDRRDRRRSAHSSAARPAPCRPRWRCPARAVRSWSRRPACGRIRDGPGSSIPTAGSALQLVDRHALVAGQMQQRVEQHRAVAGRQHEAVAIRPRRIGRDRI